MNRYELKRKLDELGIPQSSYSLCGGDAILIPIIGKKDGKWFIYEFDERGNRYQQFSFDKEEDVCECFYQKIIENQTFKSKKLELSLADKKLTYKVTKKGAFIVFEDGIPKWKNGVEICSKNPIILNGKPVLLDDNDEFDGQEVFHDFD
jgi:hypothetical protein